MPKQHHGLEVIQRLGQSYRAMQSAFSGQVGHALPRWRILLTLHEQGVCSQKMLADRCRLDPASLTRLLQAMQQQGWITRTVDQQDNRVTNASLTPEGLAVVNEALPKRAEFFDNALQGLSTEEIQTLIRSLSILEENFTLAATPRSKTTG